MKKNKLIVISEIEFEKANILQDSEFIFTTKEWLKFLILEKKGKPIILKVEINNKEVHFVGLIFKKMGLKMCGSPFEGWSSSNMGFIGLQKLTENEINTVLKETVKFLKFKKHCAYIQICDWNIEIDFAKKYKYKFDVWTTPVLDVTRSEDELFSSFKTDVRTNSRNFIKRGSTLEIVPASKDFGKEYYRELVDVFAKQNLESYYSENKICNFMESFENSQHMILCEQVRGPENLGIIATGIFLGYKKRFYFFGAASYRESQIYRPNEYVIWNAILYWKKMGCEVFDMMGTRKYKEKFMPINVSKPILFFETIPLLHFFKNFIKKLILLSRKK